MRKRLYLDKIKDRLAEDMWGTILERIEFFSGLILYKCEYYDGFIIDDKNFKIDNELKKKISPVTIFETYTYRNEKFIIERTDRNEEIPDKLIKKYDNGRYNERVNLYALSDKYMDILKYYHRSILKHIFENKIDEKSKSYRSLQGYVNSEKREIIKYMAINAPEFIKKKDRKNAKKHLEKVLEKRLKLINNKEKSKDEKIELIKDDIKQKIEVLYG
ncbi:hypothetical protein [Sporosalibacterium faouarense]|uniref:hypothetical protein n=1 Tax=Sporosalibacterium faouarense TaxID=516123 RepID=UPI00141CAD6C|nr:hypothetical protein [Sporosalibacterium faouarense]MTI49594.1 hypothetical protein [Bacillota bacterium]